jgi:F5/8 type C domain-containing protein
LVAPAGYTYSYDSAGNQTNDNYTGGGQRTFDAENRMNSAQGFGTWQYYKYSGDGLLVRRIVNGFEVWQVYGIDGELLAEYPQNATPTQPQREYGYRNGELLITATPGLNIALGKPATQIDDHHPLTIASKAVDGNTDGAQWDGFASGTNYHLNSWWQVDLQSVQNINSITVWGRTGCCWEMARNFSVATRPTPRIQTTLSFLSLLPQRFHLIKAG